MTERSLTPLRVMALVGRGVFIELLRRKDLYVLVILMGLFMVGMVAVAIVGIEHPSTATFLLNLGLTLAYFAAHILTLLLSVRQLPVEIENRTIYPMLARPIERHWLLLGKWAACTACGVVTFLVLFLMGWLPVPKLEACSSTVLVQMLLLQFMSLAMLSGVAMLLSLVLPRGVVVAGLGVLFVMGGKLTVLARNTLEQPVSSWVAWMTGYLPDFSKVNMITRYTDGIDAVALPAFAALIAYAALFTAMSLAAGTWVFQRRTL